MAIDPVELRRGRICLAVFPFATRFPLVTVDGVAVENVEAWARTHRGAPVEIAVSARLRPVLLLHDRTRAEHGDVLCLRVNTVKPELRRDERAWELIERHEHPFFFHLPKANARYALREDSVVALASLGAVHRSAVLAATGGELSRGEMQVVAERLARLIELDLSARIARRARELLARAGHTPT